MPRLPESALRLLAVSLCLAASGCSDETQDPPERPPGPPVVVYAARDADAMRRVLDAYTDETGITVLLTTESGRSLVERISAEKHRATADLVILDSIGHLWTAVANDILRPSRSDILEKNIPEKLRDPDKLWFALLVFTRTIAYDKRKVERDELSNYSVLGDDRWRGELCLSSASDVDDQAQIAMMIREHGERPTEYTVRSWVTNLAIPIVSDDTELLRAIEDGRCSLGVVNSDDLARFTRDHPGTAVRQFLPRATSGGTHISVVGAAVTRHANNPAGALHLLEWLSSEKGQKLLAAQDLEVPVNELSKWSALQISPTNLSAAGFYHEDAVSLMDRAHYGRAD
jgi:iron(III) transport system substrate-binding protein